jgi:hypothetical protein
LIGYHIISNEILIESSRRLNWFLIFFIRDNELIFLPNSDDHFWFFQSRSRSVSRNPISVLSRLAFLSNFRISSRLAFINEIITLTLGLFNFYLKNEQIIVQNMCFEFISSKIITFIQKNLYFRNFYYCHLVSSRETRWDLVLITIA